MKWREATNEEAANLWIVSDLHVEMRPGQPDRIDVELLPTGGYNTYVGLRRLSGAVIPAGWNAADPIFLIDNRFRLAKTDETGLLFIEDGS